MSANLARARVIHAILERQAVKYGDRCFLRFGDQEFGFATFNHMANRVAGGLQNLGISKGDKVAVVMDNCPEFLFSIYGLSKLGAVQVPINTAHKGEILAYMLDHSDSCAVIAQPQYLERILPVLPQAPKLRTLIVAGPAGEAVVDGRQTIRWANLVANDGSYTPAEVSYADPVAIMYTSGTTGPSKGVLTPHNLPITVSERLCEGVLGDQDCMFTMLPLFHNGGQVVGCLSALMSGARLVVGERFSASTFWSEIRRSGCTAFTYIGSVLPMLYKVEPRPDDRDHPLRVGIGGGAPRDIFHAFETRFGLTLLEFYGQSEIGVPLVSDRAHRKAGACGRVHPDYVARLVGDDGLPVGPNRPGELLIRPEKAHIIGLEYYKMAEKTVEVWRDLWYHTGEYLSCDEEGFYYFVDRKKDALRRRGENISSFEVEKVINSHPAVLESAAIGIQSGMGAGEDEVMACITLRPGHELDPIELIGYCEKRMAYFMVPRYLRFMSAMPKTASMRIEKYKLRLQGVTPDTWDLQQSGYKLRK